ncbi:FabD/lysophospholipase-like protein [Daldinia decipiens]|uniref:FabD/lysophospholipase-like protein n=1 Tax=Daldinia decipiens TaxID=326647 RepID=UPI0020C2C428|nr:FabD/lysophospholipase-like protein [Daldinia decipiens]KAI1659634.1 FabD/lysophospholipase-like protein [Daldinia decipiens]
MPSNSNVPPQRRLRLLALDGGGVRGLVSLLILKRLMHLINPKEPPKPCDVFDMIVGTSTGGLIAIMLGRLRMDVSSCIEAYTDMSKDVFKISLWTKILGRTFFNIIGRATFDYKVLEDKIRGLVQDRLRDTDAALLEEDPECKMFVCASMSNADTRRLRNYHSSIEEASNCRIWEAARATSAAPTFFDPITFSSGCTFRDGALRSNNPIFELVDEVQTAFPDLEVSCIVSIGTGIPGPITLRNSLMSVAKAYAKIMTDAEHVAEQFKKIYCSPDAGFKGKYFRCSPTGIGDVRLDEWEKVDVMISSTESYLQKMAEDLKDCATHLR